MILLDDKDARFKNLFGKAAVFVLLAAIGMGLAFFWSGVKKGAFTAKSPVYFVADSGQDLNEGMPVKFSGFKIGKLGTLALDDQGRVQVEVDIETRYLKLLRQDALITLKKEGVIGDGVLDISRGTEEKPVLLGGGKVRFERASGLEQAVIDVKDRVMPVIDEINHTLHDPDGDVRQTLKNLRQFSAEMRGTRERIDRVLGSLDANLNNEVGPLLRSLRTSATNAESISTKLDHDLPALLQKADSSMENLNTTSAAIKDAVQRAAPQLPGMMGEARDTMGKARDMAGDAQVTVDALNATWPLKNAVPPPETGAVRMDSHD